MPLETATYIHQLDSANPLGSDPIAAGDDHLRLIKAAIKATFPNITGPVNLTQAQINDGLQKAGGTMTGALVLSGNATEDLHAVPRQQVVQLAQALYPVGSIYINATNPTNPGSLLGFGTWVAFGAGRVPVGINPADPLFDTAEETGGSKDAVVVAHTHTATSTVTDPGHTHQMAFNRTSKAQNATPFILTDPNVGENLNGSVTLNTTSSSTGVTVATSVASAGSSGTNANLPPYITVYMWKRTA